MFFVLLTIALIPLATVCVIVQPRRAKSPARRFYNLRNRPFCGEEPLRERVAALRSQRP